VQGIILVLVWRAFQVREAPAEPAPKGAAQAKVENARPNPNPKPEAKPAASPAEPAATSDEAPKSEDEAPDLPRVDGSGANAPTCADVWAQNPPREGSYPGAAYAQARQANKWITRGDVDRAQHAYCLAVHWDKDNVGFMVGLGHLYLLRRDGEQAIPLLKRALDSKPDAGRSMALLGDAHARTGDYEKAREYWLRSAAHEPGDREALRSLAQRDLRRARRHFERRELVHAEGMFRRAAVMDAKNIKAAVGLSRSLTLLNDAKAARAWAEYAVKLDARDPEARIALGDALHKLGDVEAARVEYKEAQLLDPANREANQRMRRLAGDN
jgi:tetratricopeptide (TPR) repeat protein